MFEIMYYIHGNIQAQSHIMTGGQLVSQSFCHAPTGAQDQIFVCQTVGGSIDVERPLCSEDGYGTSVYTV
jgi:hypothetical protein